MSEGVELIAVTGTPDFLARDAAGAWVPDPSWASAPGVTDEIRSQALADPEGTAFAFDAFGRYVPQAAAARWWTPFVARWGALALVLAVVLLLMALGGR